MVGAFAEGNVLQVLLVSVILGSTLVAIGPRGKLVIELLEIGSDMLFRAVAIVMWVAPIGAFGAIAFTVGRYGAGALASLGNLLACFSFNLDGTCLYLASVALFLAQATNTPLDIYQQLLLLGVLLLTSKGAAGVAGAAFVVLAATLSTVGSIPVASVALILGVHRLLAEGLVPVNLLGNAVATIIVSKWEGALDKSRLDSVLADRLPASPALVES
jgi:Na+/H+-dicarboxylate symporter